MVRLCGTKVLRYTLLSLLVLTLLPLTTGAQTATSDTVSPAADEDTYLIYLPIVARNARLPALLAPDLVVESVTVTADSAIVVIKNRGEVAVSSDDSFWVDLYIDPERMPTGVNDVWYHLSDQGVVWGIKDDALPLEPGETLTLLYCPDSPIPNQRYVEQYTRFDSALAPGTPIAVQVDSANLDDVVYGGVSEDHEIWGLAYNNIGFTLSIAGSGCGGYISALPSGDGQPSTQSGRLPPRSRNLD